MTRAAKVVSLLFIAALAILAAPSPSLAQVSVGISVHIGPPALPVYAQPICPGPGYIWTPGYWAWDPDGGEYYWVPGTWVIAPAVGLLWTPGYWGWGGGVYVWHAGYWGPHVGFYGGINYGFGYTGVGFYGGEWRGGVYHYNASVTNVNKTIIHNTYNTTVINNNTTINRVSYNGGHGGTTARPTGAEIAAAHERHREATPMQMEHQRGARSNPEFRASVNHGNPAVAATAKPGMFHGSGVAPAHASANVNRPPAGNVRSENRAMNRNDRPPSANGNRNNGSPNADRPHGQGNVHNESRSNGSRPSENNRPTPESRPNHGQPHQYNPQTHSGNTRAPEQHPTHQPEQQHPEKPHGGRGR